MLFRRSQGAHARNKNTVVIQPALRLRSLPSQQSGIPLFALHQSLGETLVKRPQLQVLAQKRLLTGLQGCFISETPILNAFDVAEVLEDVLGIEEVLVNFIEITECDLPPRHERFEGALFGRRVLLGEPFPQGVEQCQCFHAVKRQPLDVLSNGGTKGLRFRKPARSIHPGRVRSLEFARSPLTWQDDQTPFRSVLAAYLIGKVR